MAEPKKRQQDPRTPLESESIPPPVRRRSVLPLEKAPPWLGPVRRRTHIDTLWLLVCAVMSGAGWMFFGWRALWSLAVIVVVAVITFVMATRAIRHFWPARSSESYRHVIVLALLAGLSLQVMHELVIFITAGFVLGLLPHVVGRTHRLRIHSVSVVLVLVWIGPSLLETLSPSLGVKLLDKPVNAVLRPNRLFYGDVSDYTEHISFDRWTSYDGEIETDAMQRFEPYSVLVHDQEKMLEPPSILVNMLTSGELVRIKQLLFGAVPGAIGGSSRGLLILIGFYLIYRRIAQWHTALAGLTAAFTALLLMPVRLGEHVTLVAVALMDLEPAIAISYVSYMLLGSPLVLLVMILAPMSAPIGRTGQVVYGGILGGGLIGCQWFFQTPLAAPLSLLIASALSRPLDVLHRSPFARRMTRNTVLLDG